MTDEAGAGAGAGVHVLIIDDDAGLRGSLTLILEDEGYRVTVAPDGEEGLRKARGSKPDLVLVDVRMPGMDGLEVTRRLRDEAGGAAVIVMTAYGGIDLAVEAVQAGAADYLPKPFGAEQVLLTVRKVEERKALEAEVGRLRGEVEVGRRYGGLVAESEGMRRVLEMARKVAQHPTSVLVAGETGTGKEMLARLVHSESPRAGGPFVPVNCGAIPESLMESEFFGHVKGAFTGAERDRDGLFVAAQRGTLFLDEVGELPEALQVKLLRVLQERVVRPVGASTGLEVDVRVLAATNRDLEAEVQAGRFRQDLFYRLAVLTLELPPLRDREGDLVLLVRHLLERHARRMGMEVPTLEAEALECLRAHRWPGNVRELENVLERALVLVEGGRVRAQDLPPELRAGDGGGRGGAGEGEGVAGAEGDEGGAGAPGRAPGWLREAEDLSVKRWRGVFEAWLIEEALRRTDGHRGEAAELLELSDRALRYKIREYELGD